MTAAKIVFNINEHKALEIPYEYYVNNSKANGPNARLHYIDIKEYERKIRADERSKVKKRKIQCRRDFIKISKMVIKYTFQKAVGAAIVFCAASTIYNAYMADMVFGFSDCLLALLTLPVGIYMFFSKHFFFKKRS